MQNKKSSANSQFSILNSQSNNNSQLLTLNSQLKKVCIIGLGYIGLPTAALLANKGYEVHGVDIVQETVDTINRGEIHIVEPELDTFVKSAVNSGNLKADTKPTKADIFIIAVPTPFRKGHVPNIDYVISATKSIVPFVEKGNIVILESTSPVGTTDKVEEILKQERPELFGIDNEKLNLIDNGKLKIENEKGNSQFSTINYQLNNHSQFSILNSQLYIAHCPERVLPGKIMRELVENDRIVGGINEEATKQTAKFYRSFVQGEVLETDAKTAEMAKLTENSFRDVNIAFANELSILCDKFGIDVWELISLTNRHPRVNVLQPGAGVGGHCIAVDPWFIVHAGGDDAKIIRTAREVNTYKTEWVIEKIKNAVNQWIIENGKLKMENEKDNSQFSTLNSQLSILNSQLKKDSQLKQPKVAIMGLAFKPNIDDLRESPALYIAKRLTNELAENVICVEPNISSGKLKIDDVELEIVGKEAFENNSQFSTINSQLNNNSPFSILHSPLEKVDIVVFLVAHKEFSILNSQFLTKKVLDFCGVVK